MKKTIITLSLLVSFASASSDRMCAYYVQQALVSHKKVYLYLKNQMTDNICLYIDFAITDNLDATANCGSDERKKTVEILSQGLKLLQDSKETYCNKN